MKTKQLPLSSHTLSRAKDTTGQHWFLVNAGIRQLRAVENLARGDTHLSKFVPVDLVDSA